MKATETTILNLIGGLDKVFIIPPFQRNYEWNFEQCEELFSDVVNAHKNNKTHYLGNVVYYKGKNDGASYNEFILVDGQQRVTTILLILCALRDSLPVGDDNIRSINNRYLLNDTGDNRFRVRLKQTSYDTNSFTSIIDNTPIQNEDNNVVKNYNKIKELISSCEIRPIELYNAVTKLEVVDVNLQIEDDLNAVQTVFEKINSTGKRLTQADLIRNYLLLAENSEQQDRLYEDYWVKIEQLVKNDNISKFARDYLIINIFEDIQADKTYKMFKEYFNENKASHVDILRDMNKYAKYFSWVRFESCPANKINRIIKYLNYIKTDDVYPIYLYLFEKLYEKNIDELGKILSLLADFMIRYRIVSPSGGGGALRSVVNLLLENLNSGVIKCVFDDIYFELSNSNAPSGRFPDDEEFKNALMNSVSANYAKTVLLKIEEKETKNTPLEFEKVTIEHIMPQTLSTWWVENLSGKENADIVFDKYLNCIGNLTPISQGYNSKISNKSWADKVKELKYVQFKVTTELAVNKKWDEESISKRNTNLADRACKAIIGPLERTRKYQTKNSSGDFSDGVYPVSDLTTPMSGATPEIVIYENKEYESLTWKDMLNTICYLAYQIDEELFTEIVENNKIHKSTSKKNYPQKDPIITSNDNLLVKANLIKNTVYFTEGNISSDRVRFYVKQLLDLYGVTDRFKISVRNR
ncbi:MAG: DUF262 domain-containing protein [Erysipelotrichaceae bacterium]